MRMLSRVNSLIQQLRALSQRLTAPDRSVRGPELRRQSALLASSLWLVQLVNVGLLAVRAPLVSLHLTVETGSRLGITLSLIVLIAAARRGYVQAVGLAAAVVGALVLFGLALAGLPDALNYLMITILFGSLFVPLRLNLGLLLAQLAALLLLGTWSTQVSLAQVIIGPFSLLLTTGVIILVMARHRNLLERSRLAQLASSEQHLNDVIVNNVEGMLVLDGNDCVCFLNPAAERLLNRPAAQILNVPVGLPLSGDQPVELDLQCDGRPSIVEMRALDITWDNAPARLITLHDVTARKQADDERRISEEKVRYFIEQSMEGIALLDESGRVVEWNPALEQITGWSRTEVLGRFQWDVQFLLTPSEYQTPERYERFKALIQTALRTGEGAFLRQPVEAPLMRADGGRRTIQQLTFPIRTDSGYRIGLTALDITARKTAEDQLRLLSRAVEQSPACIVMTDPAGNITYVNPAFTAVTGYALDEVLGRNPRILQSGLTPLDTYRQLWETLLCGETWQGEFLNRKKSGALFWGSASISPITDNQGQLTHYLAVQVDITERKRMESSEREQRLLAQALRETAAALNSTLQLDEVFDRILENVGRVVPHDTANILLLDSSCEVAYVARSQLPDHQGSTETVPMRHFAVARLASLRQMMETHQPYIVADTRDDAAWLPTPDREWLRSYLGVPMVIHDQIVGFLNVNSARPNFYSVEQAERLQAFASQAALALNNAQLYETVQRYSVDLERRVAERTRDLTAANAQLAEANARLTELDRLKDDFVSRISHELRTPLTSIRIYLELLDHGKPEKQAKYREILNRESARLEALIVDLLEVQRLAADDFIGQRQAVDVNHLILNLLAERSDALRERQLHMLHDLRSDLLPAMTDPILVRQAVANVLKNALDYTPAGGQVLVTTDLRHQAQRAWVTITIADTGPGISDEDYPHIFERFYRGAAARNYTVPGTGLGLVISRDILNKLGGQISCERRPERGAVFAIWLPAAASPGDL